MASARYRDCLRGLPNGAVVMDVSARDGLQSVSGFVEPVRRAAWVAALLDAGVDEVEAASFVNPAKLPQMSGAGEVLSALGEERADRVWSLAPNLKGVKAALTAGARNVTVFVSATETHSRANLGMSVGEALGGLKPIAEWLGKAGVRSRVALSVAWTDPQEGLVPTEVSAALCGRFAELGFREITLCDTHGGATPGKVAELIDAIGDFYRPSDIGLHMHDTFGLASANVLAGLLCGVSRFDGSILGLGGCPFLAGARGNMDTANLVRLLEGLGVSIHTNIGSLSRAAGECQSILNGRSGK